MADFRKTLSPSSSSSSTPPMTEQDDKDKLATTRVTATFLGHRRPIRIRGTEQVRPDDGLTKKRRTTSTAAINKNDYKGPTASKACPPAGGRAGSAHDGHEALLAASTTNIDQALCKDNAETSFARTLPRSRLDRLYTTPTPTEGVADERCRSRSLSR